MSSKAIKNLYTFFFKLYFYKEAPNYFSQKNKIKIAKQRQIN